MIGWWTVFFPLDWAAVLHYAPYELLWFLLQLICSPEFQLPRRGFSPFRWSMTSLAMQSWEGVGEDDVDFIDCEGRGVGNELFVKVLADDRGASQCVSAYRRTW